MRSASAFNRSAWLGLFAVCGLLLVGALSGCATTQETAAQKRAESKRILEARERRQERQAKTDRSRSKR